jgi:spermidine/putrescine transport system ATP-binding protein
LEKPILQLSALTKEYNGNLVVDKLDLSIQRNEFVTLLGPSGCGKTTTLRMIGGFEKPSSGEIYFDGKPLSHIPANAREVNTVFQKYALFPHMNIYHNIAFGLKIKKLPKQEIDQRVRDALAMISLRGFEERAISSLSGGQQQRVAIARAIVNRPKVLILDEPLGALDLKMRKEMQLELKRIQKTLGITFIYVTHDQEEALTMSDRIVVMNHGHILQIGKPTDVYNEPQSAFVADFIGESNILDGIMKHDRLVNILGVDLECLDKGFSENEPVSVVIRPEDIRILPASGESAPLQGKVISSVFKGVHWEMEIAIKDTVWLVHSTDLTGEGQDVCLSLEKDALHVMKRETNLV